MAEGEALAAYGGPALVPGVVVADSDEGVEDVRDEVRRGRVLATLPLVLITRRPQWVEPAAEGPKLLTVGQPVRRTHLLQAVLVATGRATQVTGFGQPDLADADAPAVVARSDAVPSVDEVEQDRRLILVAEDHPINRQVLRHQLELLGYAAEMVENGRQALEAWRSGRFDLLLTDCQMPEMDGYTVAREIRRAESGTGGHLPIVAITAGVMAEDLQQCLAAGMDVCLAKPIGLAELREELERFLSPRRSGVASWPRAQAPAAVADEPPLDRAALFGLFGEDDRLIGQLLAEYVSCNRRIEQDLVTALGRRDWEEVRQAAHKLAGSSRTLGARRLADLSSTVEHAVLVHDFAEAERSVVDALVEVRRVADYVSAIG